MSDGGRQRCKIFESLDGIPKSHLLGPAVRTCRGLGTSHAGGGRAAEWRLDPFLVQRGRNLKQHGDLLRKLRSQR